MLDDPAPAYLVEAKSKGRRDDVRALEMLATRSVSPPEQVYHYTSVAAAIKIIEQGKLRLGSPKNANDPYDCMNTMWQTRTPEFADRLREAYTRDLTGEIQWKKVPVAYRAHFGEARNRIAMLPAGERGQEVNRIVTKLIDGHLSGEEDSEFRYLRHRLRVCSFSELPENMLMWAHYAQKQAGCVIGFSSNILEQHWKRPLLKVRYVDTPPSFILDPTVFLDRFRIDGGRPPLSTPDVEAWTCSKARCWEYEREWRFAWLDPRGTIEDYGFSAFPAAAIRSIRLGLGVEKNSWREIAQIVESRYPDCQVLQMQLKHGEFGLSGSVMQFPKPVGGVAPTCATDSLL